MKKIYSGDEVFGGNGVGCRGLKDRQVVGGKPWLVILLLGLVITACGGESPTLTEEEEEPPVEEITLEMADPEATQETKALYSRLWALQSEGVMFGHHDDLIYGRNWIAEQGRSDIHDITGDYPAVYSVDLAEIMNAESAVDPHELNADRRRTILEARERGEVIIANAHINNPLTGGDAWDNSSDQAVRELLTEGTETHAEYRRWLDNLADFLNTLEDDRGNLVPVIFRPYHEHNHSWSWWGSSAATEEEFIELWRYTVEYLRDSKEVHNLIYAISPQLDSVGSTGDLLYRWPGDEYVDFIGMDSYHGTNTEAFSTNLKNLEALIKDKKKPGGVTETGIEGIRNYNGVPLDSYWTEEIMTPIIGREISMVVMWRNKYDPHGDGYHYYAPFEGHSSAPDFKTFYESTVALFSSDLPDMYQMADGVTVK